MPLCIVKNFVNNKSLSRKHEFNLDCSQKEEDSTINYSDHIIAGLLPSFHPKQTLLSFSTTNEKTLITTLFYSNIINNIIEPI